MATWLRGRESAAHRASSNAGTATPGARSSNRDGDGVTDVRSASTPSSRRPISRSSVLLDEFDVDQHERQVGVEAGQERLAHDGPRPHGAPPADRGEFETGIGADAQCGQTTSGGIGELPRTARSAPR